MADSSLGKITLHWVLNKIQRLAHRFVTRDFIRKRAKRVYPLKSSGLPAYAIAHNDFGAYCVPLIAAHRPAARYIMAGRIWEPNTLKFLAENIGDGDIIHAGTSFGDFLPFLSKQMSADTQIWAFEPNSVNYKSARLTLEINEIKNVRLTNAGLGPRQGTGALVIENNRGLALGGASYVTLDANNTSAEKEEIDIIALDELIPNDRRISILQLDVEGYEELALTGAIDLIKRNKPILVLETLPSENWLTAHAHPLGYVVIGKVDENHILKTADTTT